MSSELTGRDVHAAWRDGMLAQGRAVSPERMTWDTLSEEDRLLDDGIAATLGTARAGEFDVVEMSDGYRSIVARAGVSSELTPEDKARYNEQWGLAPGACNCHHGSARYCPVHSQADYDAARAGEGLREALRDIRNIAASLGGPLPDIYRLEIFAIADRTLAALHPDTAADLFVVCGIGGCDFAVERGEGRTMALHQSEDHPDTATGAPDHE